MVVSEKLDIQSYFYSIVHVLVYWNLTLESTRKHHELILFSL